MLKRWMLLGMSIFLVGCSSSQIPDTEKENLYVETENVNSESEETQEEPQEETQTSLDWVSELKVAKNANQMIVVAAEGSSATVSMHTKNADGLWEEILSTSAIIGRNGIGKTKEGDGKTPTGIYHFTFAFGNQDNPGTVMPYTKVDETYYWVDDVHSRYYNQFVTTNEVEKDWNSAEHIAAVGRTYNYVLATDYNIECVPGVGSAIFMHCTPTGGAGCIAVSESAMIEIMQNVKPECVLIIDSATEIYNY